MQCVDADWSPIAGAGAKSGFAALLAGFVFACLVTVITQRGPGRTDDNVTIRLFLAAFVCLVSDSFVALQLADNTQCQRAWTESMIYNSLLTVGTVAILSGLAWLISRNALAKVVTQDPGNRVDLQRFVVLLTYAVAAVALIHLEFGARGYLFALSGNKLPATWYGWAVVLFAPIVILVAVVMIPVSRARRTRGVRRGDPQPDATGHRDVHRDALRVAATATSVVVIVQVVVVSLVGDLPTSVWQNPPWPLVALGSVGPLVLAAIPVLALVLALPLPDRYTAPTAPAAPASTGANDHDG